VVVRVNPAQAEEARIIIEEYKSNLPVEETDEPQEEDMAGPVE
jgi:hypothetical protein